MTAPRPEQDPRAIARGLSTFKSAALRALGARPIWIRSLGPLKGKASELCDQGLAERVKPPGGAARNMMRLTPAGLKVRAALEERKSDAAL